MPNPENMDFVQSEDVSRWAPSDSPNSSLVNMSGRAADKLAQRVGMVVEGKPVRLRAAWVEFARIPTFLRENWDAKDNSPTGYPVLVDLSEFGLIFAHDPSGLLVWDPDDAKAEGGWDMSQEWRQVLVPWSHVVSMTADLDCEHYKRQKVTK